MTRKHAEAAVIGAITEIQEMSGRECIDISGTTIPICGVPGFDSLNGLEATVEIAEHLKMEIPNETNIFTNEAGDQALTVSQIANRLLEIAGSSEVVAHAK